MGWIIRHRTAINRVHERMIQKLSAYMAGDRPISIEYDGRSVDVARCGGADENNKLRGGRGSVDQSN